ncbi:MAG: extracellular solute-binding protein [bacterium]|nr:extracellular solute-binding protein [bacterium]
MKKKSVSVLLCISMIAVMLAGCGNSAAAPEAAPAEKTETAVEATADTAEATEETAASAESRTIKILSMWPEDDAATTANGSIITAMCEQYKAEVDPNFTWEFEYVDSDNLKTKVQTLAASDDLPDIFAYDAGTPLVDLIDADLVLDVTKALTDEGVYDKLDNGATTYLAALTGTEDIYDLPLGLNIEGFWYNKALFEQAGIKEAPATWDEMLADADKLLAAGIQPFATGAGDSWPATRLIHAYAIRSMGKDCMQAAADGTEAYNSAGFVEAAQTIQDMNQKGYFGVGATTVDQNTAADMVLAGEAAMIYNGSWYTSALNADTNPAGADGIGFFNIPTVAGGKGAATEYAMNCGTILCMNKSSYDDTMAAFLKYFVSNVGDYSMNNFGALKGYVIENYPADMSNYTKLVAEEMEKVTGSANWFEALMNGELSTIAQENVQSLMNGDMTAQEYCDAMQECYEATR